MSLFGKSSVFWLQGALNLKDGNLVQLFILQWLRYCIISLNAMETFVVIILIASLIFIMSTLSARAQLILMMVSLILFSLFAEVQSQVQFFKIVAFIIACFYVLLMTIWFNNSNQDISFISALLALFGCGFMAIVLATSFLYPFWNSIGYEEITTGWWVFSRTEMVAKHDIVLLLDQTGIIAGPVEELAKLFAVLVLMKNHLVSRKLTLFYVVLCALGFAMIENIYYFIRYEDILLIRANPAHAVFSAIWGVALGRWLLKEAGLVYFLWMLLLGMGLHAVWNFFATIESNLFVYIFMLVSLVGLFYIKLELQKE